TSRAAVMRVVEKQPERGAALAQSAQLAHEARIVPLVHEHEVGASDRARQIELFVIADGSDARVGTPCSLERGDTVLGDEVLHAPCVLRFVHVDARSAFDQFGRDAAEEMGVAVVPVGEQRMAEDDDVHATAPVGSGLAIGRSAPYADRYCAAIRSGSICSARRWASSARRKRSASCVTSWRIPAEMAAGSRGSTKSAIPAHSSR